MTAPAALRALIEAVHIPPQPEQAAEMVEIRSTPLTMPNLDAAPDPSLTDLLHLLNADPPDERAIGRAALLARGTLRRVGAPTPPSQAPGGAAAMRVTLERARNFIAYARYQLEMGRAAPGSQFPKQDDADAMIEEIAAASRALSLGPEPAP